MSFLTALGEYLYGSGDQPAFSEEELNLMRQGINPATQPAFSEEELNRQSQFRPTGGGGWNFGGNVPIPADRGGGFIPTKESVSRLLSSGTPEFANLGRGEQPPVGSIDPFTGEVIANPTSFDAFSPTVLPYGMDMGQAAISKAMGIEQPIQLEALQRLSSAYDTPEPRGLTTVGGAPLSEFLSGAAMPEYGFTRSERQMAGRGKTLTPSEFDKLSAEREARMEADILSSRGAYVRDPNTGKKVAAGSKDHAIIIEAERAAERAGMTGSSKKNAFMALYKEQRQEEEELTKDLNDLKLQYETYRTQGQALNMERTRAQIEKYQKSEAEKYQEIYSIAEKLFNDGLLDEEQAVLFIIDKMGGDIDDIFGEKGDVSSFIEQAISNVGGETSPVQEFFSVEEAEAANLPSGTKVIINGRTATVQ